MKTIKNLVVALLVMISVPAMAAGTKVTTTTTRTQSIKTSTFNSALSNVYVAGQIGYGMPTDSGLEDNAVYAAAVGYKFSPVLRAELEGSYRNNDSNAVGVYGDFRNTLWMANVWYDFANSTKFTPYIGGGAGVSYARASVTAPAFATFKDHDSAFAYQAGTGVAYKLCDHMDLTADYRFIDTSNFAFGDDYKTHEVRAGVRYSF